MNNNFKYSYIRILYSDLNSNSTHFSTRIILLYIKINDYN